MIAQFSVFLTLAAAAQCPVNESADADKYPCKYSFANDAVSLYIGSHAGNVYMKATTKDKRWVVVGPSVAHMKNLHVVINHKEALVEGQGGEQSIPEPGPATGWSKPEKTAFQEEPVLSLEGESRTTELVFDAGKWKKDFGSGVSIAWGEDESKRTVEHHCSECKKFITFNGDDDQYKLPVSASVGAMGVIYLGFLLL